MKKKYFYYVVVFTSKGTKFVTNVNNLEKTCNWYEDKKPLEFGSKEVASDIALGLTSNFNFAVAVITTYELESQPYNYEKGCFEWINKEGRKDNE